MQACYGRLVTQHCVRTAAPDDGEMRKKSLPRTPKAPKAPKAERVQFSMTMAAKLLRSIDRVALETGRTRTEMFDQMGRHYLATHPDGRLVK
jgi:hypothetical protein